MGLFVSIKDGLAVVPSTPRASANEHRESGRTRTQDTECDGAALDVEAASWAPARRAAPILREVGFSLAPGRILGVVGPNGAGKSTLLRLLYRYHQPSAGRVLLDGVDLRRLSARAAARQIAAVLQEQPTDFALTVREIVMLGRTPHRSRFGGGRDGRDDAVVDEAMARLGLSRLGERHLGALSGGERQRVMIARALAQEPRLLILDEPTNHLDIRHQLEMLSLIEGFGVTIVTALHDLNMAARACDDVLLLEGGRAVGFGPPDQVLSEDAVSRVFAVAARRERLAPSGDDHFTFRLQ